MEATRTEIKTGKLIRVIGLTNSTANIKYIPACTSLSKWGNQGKGVSGSSVDGIRHKTMITASQIIGL
jgi:hypothetical protein